MSVCVNMVNTVISAAPPLQASQHHKHPKATPDRILCDSSLILRLICTVTSSLLPPECSRELSHSGERMTDSHSPSSIKSVRKRQPLVRLWQISQRRINVTRFLKGQMTQQRIYSCLSSKVVLSLVYFFLTPFQPFLIFSPRMGSSLLYSFSFSSHLSIPFISLIHTHYIRFTHLYFISHDFFSLL